MQLKTTMQLQGVVKREILEAFEATPYPGDEHIVINQSGNDSEYRDILSAINSKAWQDVSVEMVRNHAAEALIFLTPTAFRYYLPAYMIGCVEAYYDVDIALDSVLFNLTPPKERSGWEWDFFWVRVQQFNEHEKKAITLFLELMKQYEIDDWASAGLEPPENRVTSALNFWIMRQHW